MAHEPSSPVEADLPKTKITEKNQGEPPSIVFLEESRWFRPALMVATAAAVGLILAPQWAKRTYPTDRSLLGTPARSDIKAEYDDRGDIIDETTTGRLRDQAVANVKRVYDFDGKLGERIATNLRAAMEHARTLIEERVPGEEWEVAFARARAGFEQTLGDAIEASDAETLADIGYSSTFEDLLAAVLLSAHRVPVIASKADLEADAGKGIVIRWVGEERQQEITVVGKVLDVETMRRSLDAGLDEALEAQPQDIDRKPFDLNPARRGALLRIARRLVQPSLTVNSRDTQAAIEAARTRVQPVSITVKRGQMIIRDGEMFTERHLLILEKMARYNVDTSIVMVGFGAGLLVLMLMFAGLTFWRMRVVMSARDALFLATLFVASVAGARLWIAIASAIQDAWEPLSQSAIIFLLPVAAGSMVARLVLRAEAALVFGVVASLVLGLMVDERLLTAYALVGAVLGATFIGRISRRGDILRAGLKVGAAQAAMALGMQLFSAEGELSSYLLFAAAAFLSGLLAGFVALSITPVVELLFRYTTDLKLLELANLNHPALKELIVQAPGTYHHSIIVGSLVEAAAEAIGANALLAKVMAYYHDLGKGCNAMYFIENQRGNNPHDKLKPSMSAMIIRRHVTDGLEMAERYGLGPEIRAGIAEHHGTTLIQYFYARAVEEAEEDTGVNESDYRYPGRKPQSRETALVMLSDSVEAASRSLADPTPARLQGLVNKIINVKFTDGQLDECDLTLKDLHVIAKAFMAVLNSIYHHRVEYPEASKKKDEDSDQKPKGGNGHDPSPEEDRPDNIRRLGLTGR